MKNKRWIIAVIAPLISLLIASIPRLYTVEAVDVSNISDYPALLNDYNVLCEERSSYNVQTENTIQVVTVRNLWGSWERCVLPCYAVCTPDVSKAGSTDFCAEMFVLAPWNQENLFTKICNLRVVEFTMRLEPGENTFVNKMAEFTYPAKMPAAYLVESEFFSSDESIVCSGQPTISVKYRVATNSSIEETSQPVTTNFSYEYNLSMWGKRLFVGDRCVASEHLVNN